MTPDAPAGQALPPQAGEGFHVCGLGPTALAVLVAAAVVSVYAAVELRSLFADGFLYFLRILERESFWLEAPARRTVEFVRQIPVLAALKLGVSDPTALAAVFGASVELLPIALTALCWPALPRGRKHFFAFPLLTYCAGTMGASFAPIVEGPAAAAWFWLLLLLLLFRAPRGATLAAIALLAAGTILLHEGMVLLAPLLAAVSLWRARQNEGGEGARERVVFAALALWFVIVMAVQAWFILHPSHPTNRTLYFTALVSLWWLYGLWGSLNLPALFGVLAVAGLGIAWLTHAARPTPGVVARHAPHAFGAVAFAAAIYTLASGDIFAAQAQLNARNHALLMSLPLGGVAFWAAAKPAVAARLPWRAAAVLPAWLAAAALLWNVDAVRRWSGYIASFREVLRAERGLLAWEDVRAKLPPARARLFEGYSHYWIEPTMSIVLAPAGKVAAIIAARREAAWYPFDARKPTELPHSRFWNFDAYLRARP